MSELQDKAIAKITKECEGKDYLIPFEEYLTSICTTDAVANKILKEDKKLQGAFDAMKKIARERAVAQCAYIPPAEGYQIIEDYYGITESDKQRKTADVIDITDLL